MPGSARNPRNPKYPHPHTRDVVDKLRIQRIFQKMASEDTVLREFMNSRNMSFNFYTNSIESGYSFIKKACYSIFYPSLSKTPTERWIPDVLHWYINVIGRDFVSFITAHAKQLGPEKVKLLQKFVTKIAGKKPITGHDATASIALLKHVFEWVGAVQDHPNYPHICKLAKCLARLGDILLERYECDDPLIDEFQILAAEFEEIVFTHFEGRAAKEGKPGKGLIWGCECHDIDADGFRVSSRGADREYLESYPIVRFKFGSYPHATVAHMVDLMREHGDLLKYSSWVIEAANKHWKRILDIHTSCGGGRSGVHIAYQTLTCYLRTVDPDMAALSKRDVRLRNVQTCSACKQERVLGHAQSCTGPLPA